MNSYALLTGVGQDQPGIVAAVSGVLLEADCNIEDSEMTRLGGEFALMLMLRLPAGLTTDQLADKLAAVRERFGLWLHLADVPAEQAIEPRHESPKHVIHVYGADRKGIVHRITTHLADKQVNITNLHTEVVRHETPLYVMMIEVELPRTVDAGALQEQLEAIGKEIGVDVAMRPKDDARF